jgi:hypothetical protein
MPVPETVTIHVPFRVVKRGGRNALALGQFGKGGELARF